MSTPLQNLTAQDVAELIGYCVDTGTGGDDYEVTCEGTSRDGVLDITVWDADDNQRMYELVVHEVPA